MHRRLFLTGAASLLAAPAIIKVESLMRVAMPKQTLYRTVVPEGDWRDIYAGMEKRFFVGGSNEPPLLIKWNAAMTAEDWWKPWVEVAEKFPPHRYNFVRSA